MRDYSFGIGPLSHLPMTVYIWIDTNQENCKAITGKVRLEFSSTSRDVSCPMSNETLFTMLTLIDKATPIYKILVEGYSSKAFDVSKTEEYMNKGCKS